MKSNRTRMFMACLCALVMSGGAAASSPGQQASAQTANPWTLQATLSASDHPPDFGYAVGISGNLIVATANTSIDVYVRPSTGWSSLSIPAARLTTTDGGALTSVAISGTTIVAGSTQVGGTGAVYVFVQPTGGWKNMTQTAKLTASDAMAGDFVGISVAISGNTIAVGALENNSVGIIAGEQPNGTGAVYVFSKPASGWKNMTETAKLTASDGVRGDDFGFSLAMQSDTIAVAAPDTVVNSANLAGSIYVFQKSGTQWVSGTETAKLTASDAHSITVLGLGLAMNGTTIAAAAFDKAYIFTKPASGWKNATQNAELASTSYVTLGLNSVVITPTFVAVGSPLENAPFADLYVKPASGWTNMRPTYRLKPPTSNQNGADGWSLAANATTLVVSSPLLDGVGGNVVYIYALKTGTTAQQ